MAKAIIAFLLHPRCSINVLALCVSLVLIVTPVLTTTAHAQSSGSNELPDTRSPLIELETVAESRADRAQVFTAQVVDDRVLKDVSLYHRRAGQLPFIATPMRPIADSGYFSAAIKTDQNDVRAIEYYIQARDESGNRTVEGYAFDPYTRVIVASENVIASQPAFAAEEPTATSRVRWWHVAIGVGVAALLASAANGSGDDGSGNTDNGVPLNVTVTGF